MEKIEKGLGKQAGTDISKKLYHVSNGNIQCLCGNLSKQTNSHTPTFSSFFFNQHQKFSKKNPNSDDIRIIIGD